MKANGFISNLFSQQAELTHLVSKGRSPLGHPEEQACDEL